jgi:glucose-1-phosphate thymidylyltransferase
MRFVGCIAGDHAKMAVDTRILTGETVGICNVACGSVTTNVPSFINFARLLGQVAEALVDVMIARRNVA